MNEIVAAKFLSCSVTLKFFIFLVASEKCDLIADSSLIVFVFVSLYAVKHGWLDPQRVWLGLDHINKQHRRTRYSCFEKSIKIHNWRTAWMAQCQRLEAASNWPALFWATNQSDRAERVMPVYSELTSDSLLSTYIPSMTTTYCFQTTRFVYCTVLRICICTMCDCVSVCVTCTKSNERGLSAHSLSAVLFNFVTLLYYFLLIILIIMYTVCLFTRFMYYIYTSSQLDKLEIQCEYTNTPKCLLELPTSVIAEIALSLFPSVLSGLPKVVIVQLHDTHLSHAHS